MDPIYVTGHRNPDTDSIVAAMAYAALRNAVGDREYKAACLGRVSDETQLVLDRFGFEPPKRITSMYTQVQDLDFDTPPVLDANVTVAQAWKTFQAQPSIPALPVANEDGTLYGMLSKDYIATYNMDLIAGAELADVPLFNVLSVLEGKVLNDAGDQVDTISGKVTIALPQKACRYSRPSVRWPAWLPLPWSGNRCGCPGAGPRPADDSPWQCKNPHRSSPYTGCRTPYYRSSQTAVPAPAQ